MGIQTTEGQMLHAALCEIERGLFYVSYSADDVGLGKHSLPRYQVGTGAPDARRRVEQHAYECGFKAVIWEAPLGGPGLLPSPAREAARTAS
jgi:hypothetical protein